MTGEVKEKKYQLSNTVLLVILGVLILLIIALIVGVVVHNTINNVNMIEGGDGGSSQTSGGGDGGNGESDGGAGGDNKIDDSEFSEAYVDEEDDDAIIANLKNMVGSIAETGDEEATLAAYDDIIADSKERENLSVEYTFYTEKARYLRRLGQCDDAISMLNDVDVSGLGPLALVQIYSDYLGLAIDCDNKDAVAKWQGLLDKVTSTDQRGDGV